MGLNWRKLCPAWHISYRIKWYKNQPTTQFEMIQFQVFEMNSIRYFLKIHVPRFEETNTKKYVEIHSEHFVGMILLFDYILYLRPIIPSTTMRCSNCGTLTIFCHLVRAYAKTCNNWRGTCSYPNISVCGNCLIEYLIPALWTTGWELGTVLLYNSEIHMHQIFITKEYKSGWM